MAVTNQQSTQIVNAGSLPAVKNENVDLAKLSLARFDFTQVGAGDINSTVDLAKFGPGHIRIVPALSWVGFSAFGAGAKLSVGHTGYTKLDGSTVNAAAAAIEDTLDVSAAGVAFLGVGANAAGNAGGIEVESKGTLLVQAKVTGAGIPNGATVSGWIAFVRD